MKKLVYPIIIALTIVFPGCDKEIQDEIDEGIVFNEGYGTLSSDGGTLLINDPDSPLNNAYVKIPEGALVTTTDISIKSADSDILFDCDTSTFAISFISSEERFLKPVEIGIPYAINADTNDLIVFYYDAKEFVWKEIPRQKVDARKKLVIAEAEHFTPFTVRTKDERFSLELELYTQVIHSSEKIGAGIKLATPLNRMPVEFEFTRITGALNMYQLIQVRPLSFYAIYELQLKQKNSFWFDEPIETKKIGYRISETNLGLAKIQVMASSDEVLHELSWVAMDEVERYYSGDPWIVYFDHFPEEGTKYYVDVKLYYTNKDLMVVNSDGFWGSNGYFFSKYNNAILFDDMDLAPDSDADGLKNSYDTQIGSVPECEILNPSNGSNFIYGQTINFTGAANDAEGSIPDENFIWHSNHDGTIGQGKSIATNTLSANTHSISLKVSDTDGNTCTDKITVYVNQETTKPTVIMSGSAGSITSTSAVCEGSVTSSGGANVISRGFCWSKTSNPDLQDQSIVVGEGTGTFSAKITGLEEGATYYVKSFASNSAGVAYSSNELQFTTLSGASVPAIRTAPVVIMGENYMSGGIIDSDGGSEITEKGICWSTGSMPTISDNKKAVGSGPDNYTTSIDNLDSNMTYYVRAYAVNSEGLGYGEPISFRTISNEIETGNVTDYDGNVYKTVKIGNQWWMAEDLKVTHYENGTEIPLIIGSTDWANLEDNNVDKGYCFYYPDRALYNFAAAVNGTPNNDPLHDTQGVCPNGWHLPSDIEWAELIDYLGGENVAGGKMKESGTLHWYIPNTGATNESGFTGLPGVSRNTNGSFSGSGNLVGQWWSSSEYDEYKSYSRLLFYDNTIVYRYNSNKSLGFNVRCMKD